MMPGLFFLTFSFIDLFPKYLYFPKNSREIKKSETYRFCFV